MTTRLSGPLPPSGEICVDNGFAVADTRDADAVRGFAAEPLLVQAHCADARAIHMAFPPAQGEVFAPWGAYPPRLSGANIGYRTDIGSTFHTTGDKSVILVQRRKPAVSTR